MAHAATLSGLAGGLVTSVTGRKQNDPSITKLRDRAIRGLRDQSHARTNQFAIRSKLDGLTEKFAVLNREDLSDALQSRLDELPTRSRWMPEILSLLLELSDRPVENTNLEHVTRDNHEPSPDEGLTWEQIVADDPLNESGIWDDVDRGYHSSEDDFEDDLDSEPSVSTTATSADGNDSRAAARQCVQHIDAALLADVKSARDSWKASANDQEAKSISELTLAREILSMTHGLPTDLFHINDNGTVAVKRNIALKDVSSASLHHVLDQACETGSALNFLRQWTPSHMDLAFMQSLLAAIEKLLSEFAVTLCSIEQSYITPDDSTVMSALDVQMAIAEVARPLMRLSAVSKKCLNVTGTGSLFALLDMVYAEACLAQLADDSQAYSALVSVFVSGLRTYLRPVATWITSGAVDTQYRDAFFVSDSKESCQPGDFWHGRFEMRFRATDTAYVPDCVSSLAHQIFAMGKSRALLQRLDQCDDETAVRSSKDHDLPNLSDLLEQTRADMFLPFTEILHGILENWMKELGTDCTPLLRSRLLNEYGLLRTFRALAAVFFSADGALFQEFADALIERINRGRKLSNEQFLLTEVARESIGGSHVVDAELVRIIIEAPGTEAHTATPIEQIATVTITYTMSWPVQNITRSAMLSSHSKIFTLLLQVNQASSLLRRKAFHSRGSDCGRSSVLGMRQRLLCFNNILCDHIASTAAALHADMLRKMQKAIDIDVMVAVWADYERRLQLNAFLTQTTANIRHFTLRILELSEMLHSGSDTDSILEQFEQNLAFLVKDMRSVSRAGDEPALRAIFERLHWMLDTKQPT